MPSAAASISNNEDRTLVKQNSVGSVNSGSVVVLVAAAGETLTMSDNSLSTVENSNNDNSSTKEKSSTTNAANVSSSSYNPMRQLLIMIEHKIRNMEKRKTKLESYRAIQATGKELSNDQKAAVAKYDGVMTTLEFARDLSKQMLQFSKEAEKEQKKQLRKDNIARALAETAKIREVLVIQNILTCFSDESIRSDFQNGENGAVKLEQTDLEAIEKFCFDIQTRRPESTEDVAFLTAAQKAAESFSLTIDGRPKQFGDTTYENLRRIFNQIQECGYLDKVYVPLPEAAVVESNEEEELVVASDDVVEEDASLIDELVEKLEAAAVIDLETESDPELSFMVNDGDDLLQQPQQLSFELQQQQQQQKQHHDQANDQLDLQQQQIHSPMPPQQQAGIQVPASTAAANYQQQQPALQPSQPGATTTPVHVAMYAAQPTPAQLQQAGGIINVQQGAPPPQIIGAGVPAPHQRPIMTSPAGGQIPQGGGHLALHGVPPQAAGHFPPTTVRAVEQTFFKQHQHQHQQQHAQYLQHMRPLAEVIGSGSFYFLQESELDSPEINSGSATGSTTAPAPAVGSVVYESQQQQQQLHSQSQANLLTNESHKIPENQQQQQQLIVNNIQQQQQQQQQQPISTQTFTNQSFPPLQQHLSQAPLQQSVGAAQFQPKLFSPVAVVGLQHQQLLQQQHQQQDIGASNAQASIPQQYAAAVANMPAVAIDTASPIFQQKHQQLFSPVATAGIVQQQQQQQHPQEIAPNAPAVQQLPLIPKSPTLTQTSGGDGGNASNNNSQTRKNEWSNNADNGGGYVGGESVENATNDNNHWNTPPQQDNASSGGGYGRGGGGGARGSNNYQRRAGGERDDRRERSTGGYRGRANNYTAGNSSQQQNGGGGGGGRGGNASGIFFRNNENGGTGSSFYQNGSGGGAYAGNKDGGGGGGGSRYDAGGGGGNNYRGPRGNNNNVRGGAPTSRAMGRNNAGGGSGSTNSSSSGSYANSTRQSNRMPQLGLDNKN